jgi:hypothetical protein
VLITSNTSLYLLDTARPSLTLLARGTTPLRAFTTAGTVAVTIDIYGTIRFTDTVLNRTKVYETGIIDVEKISLTNNHDTLVIQTSEGVSTFSFADEHIELLTSNAVLATLLSPEEKRLLAARTDGVVTLTYLDDYFDNKPRRAGTTITLPLTLRTGTPSAVRFAPTLPDQMMFIDNGTLTVREIDDHAPLNGTTLAESVVSYDFFGNELYFLTTEGTLQSIPFEF